MKKIAHYSLFALLTLNSINTFPLRGRVAAFAVGTSVGSSRASANNYQARNIEDELDNKNSSKKNKKVNKKQNKSKKVNAQ